MYLLPVTHQGYPNPCHQLDFSICMHEALIDTILLTSQLQS